jgi:predicted DNA-binding transcriptional regulator YafY
MTVQRALVWLRDHHDVPLRYDQKTRSWQLTDPSFSLPLSDPTADDLTVALFAGALLAPLADDELKLRVDRLAEEMDDRIRASGRPRRAPRPDALTATLTTATLVEPRLLALLLASVGRQVVRIDYESPWRDTEQLYDVEPWQLRIHDGSLYLRGYSRTAGEARTFRAAQILGARVLEGEIPRAKLPPSEEIWGADPAFGIDEDRPGTAVLRIQGPLARWIAREKWHPNQLDTWIEPGELLERRVAYRSCRELARRLVTLGDALVAVEPEALCVACVELATSLVENLAPKR